MLKDEYTGKYSIVSPDTQEAYLFNRFGLHLHTVDLITGKMLYNFSYNGNALYGKLTSVSDQNNILLNIKRNFHGRVELLQTTSNQNIKIKLNNFDMLKNLITSDNRTSYKFNYVGNTGLLKSKTEYNDQTTQFNYQKNGKIEQIIGPNELSINLTYFLNSTGIVTSLSSSNSYSEIWISNSSGTFIYKSKYITKKVYKFIN